MNLKINNPCNEPWDEMPKVNETFNFCSVCDKNIYDFATMSKTEVFVTVLTAENPICGRIKKEQMQLTEEDFPALLHTLQQPRFRAKAFLVLALVCSQLLASCENNTPHSGKHSERTQQEKAGAKDNQNDNVTLGKVVKPNSSNKENEASSKGANNIKFIPPSIDPPIIIDDISDKFIFGVPNEDLTMGLPEVIYEELPPKEKDTNEVLSYADVMPEFPNGTSGLTGYLSRYLEYPAYAKENGIEGNVFVRFVVHTDGSLSDFEVLKSPDKSLSTEALKVVKMMPNWIPGQNQGKKVNVKTTIPIRFRLS